MDILEIDAYNRKQEKYAAYFYLWTPDPTPSIMSAGVKAAPALLLAAVVLSWNGGRSFLAVVSSAVGDCCLIWPELFLHGMGAFVLAHLMYSVTFLSSHYATYTSSTWICFMYMILFAAGVSFYICLYPYLQKATDSAVMTPAVVVYVALIILMATLAIRIQQMATPLGLSFTISDMMLAVHMFKVTQLEHGNQIVMVTYYLAVGAVANCCGGYKRNGDQG